MKVYRNVMQAQFSENAKHANASNAAKWLWMDSRLVPARRPFQKQPNDTMKLQHHNAGDTLNGTENSMKSARQSRQLNGCLARRARVE